ncbi:Uncharacterized protein TCAP_06423, partial [Tolypocladium capitatum]
TLSPCLPGSCGKSETPATAISTAAAPPLLSLSETRQLVIEPPAHLYGHAPRPRTVTAMSSPASNYVPFGPDDQGAFVVITAVLGVTWTVLMLTIRLYIRSRINGPFGLDDLAALLGTLFAVCQSSVVLVAVHNGLGKRTELLQHDSLNTVMKDTYVANFLYVVAVCCSKCSMSLLIARLTKKPKHLVASHGVTGFTIMWAIASLFIMGFQCSLPRPWDMPNTGHCSTLVTRWAIVEAFSVFIEVLISGMSILLVWDLSTALRSKLMVIAAFSAQLFVAIPIGFRLSLVRKYMRGPEDSCGFTNAAIATQAVMHFSVMAATFPCFRQFLKAFDSGLCATTKIGTEDSYGSKGASDYVLQSLSTAHEDDHGGSKTPQEKLRPDSTAQITTKVKGQSQINPTGDESKSIESDGSDRAIIRRTQQWEIRYETQPQRGV